MPLESQEPVEPSIWEERSDGTFSAPFERTYTDRKFLGVAGGLARYWGVDALWTRLALIVTCASVPWLRYWPLPRLGHRHERSSPKAL